MEIHKFDLIDDVLEASIKLVRNIKEERLSKTKGYSYLNSLGMNKEGA